ncbi:SRPBCC family protein [Terrimonas sp. NA20]|uniref:SRPBCC family protein n=1 Tax=Terrimonas ginsenosidimutans TaxID=2908004 RepID=A0ABS9KVD9_9BACT|nr:SRPBCC family protein [Terrimonas ginsenosidimutans]MCG2616247.1 SRPBCC family protein [Terrimonas ginsenosidimutans]
MLHTIKTRQLIKSDLSSIWSFMSDPGNLARITPAYLGFKILSEDTGRGMHAGQIIEYYVRPLLGIKLHWVTEITHVEQGKLFVDEQRFGPYSFWHHKHFLEETQEGVIMTDLVHYKLPLGPLGKLANTLFVKRQLDGIFRYRYQQVEQWFTGPITN